MAIGESTGMDTTGKKGKDIEAELLNPTDRNWVRRDGDSCRNLQNPNGFK